MSGCAGEVWFHCYLCCTSANHLTQWLVQPAGDSNTSALPGLASISGELKSCFMDRIHGGHCSLITAALHVLLGTDCKARQHPTQHPPSPIWGCLEYCFVEISRQMQISYSANTMVQIYKCHCNFFTFLPCCLQQVHGVFLFSFFSFFLVFTQK